MKKAYLSDKILDDYYYDYFVSGNTKHVESSCKMQQGPSLKHLIYWSSFKIIWNELLI